MRVTANYTLQSPSLGKITCLKSEAKYFFLLKKYILRLQIISSRPGKTVKCGTLLNKKIILLKLRGYSKVIVLWFRLADTHFRMSQTWLVRVPLKEDVSCCHMECIPQTCCLFISQLKLKQTTEANHAWSWVSPLWALWAYFSEIRNCLSEMFVAKLLSTEAMIFTVR